MRMRDENLLMKFFGVTIKLHDYARAAGVAELLAHAKTILVAGMACAAVTVREAVFKTLDQEHQFDPYQRLLYCLTELYQ
jgi:hypothetical protein